MYEKSLSNGRDIQKKGSQEIKQALHCCWFYWHFDRYVISLRFELYYRGQQLVCLFFRIMGYFLMGSDLFD